MSVDTFLKGKNTSRYAKLTHDGLQILVAPNLMRQARWIALDFGGTLLWKGFRVEVEPEGEHFHSPACRH